MAARTAAEALENRLLLTVSLADGGFEQPSLGVGNFAYTPSGSAWQFSGTAAIASKSSGFTVNNADTHQGLQVGVILGTAEITQTVDGWDPSQPYVVSFTAAPRFYDDTTPEDFQVLIDDSVVGTFAPQGSGYTRLSTNSFTVTAGSHTIKFRGLNTANDNNTALIDDVRVGAPQARSAPYGFWISGAPQATAGQTYSLQLHNGASDVVVRWGDGSSDTYTVPGTTTVTHVYSASGMAAVTATSNDEFGNPQTVALGPDSTFGSGGFVFGQGGYTSAVVVQPDGKTVIGGIVGTGMGLRRFNVDGTLDTTFGTNGSMSPFWGEILAVTLLPNGQILAAGHTYGYQFAVARVNANGTLDSTFGPSQSGLVTTSFASSSGAACIGVASDGHIILAGGSDANFAIAS